jgi:type I restriction-modification system DNA methylase subunit
MRNLRYIKFKKLTEEYKKLKEDNSMDLSSEETIRTWLNKMLEIFGWDVGDPTQITQEKSLNKVEVERLKKIDSTNTKPDYIFKIASQKLTFLDAKDITVNIKTDSGAAFQIKSYGWSITAPCVFLSNFEEFAIYDCTYIPEKNQSPDFGRIYLTIDNYLENFAILESHLLKENIYGGKLQTIYENTLLNNNYVKKITPDHAFAFFLSNFRLALANNLLLNNTNKFKNNVDLLSYIVQVIINRILFVRVCEARNIEEEGLLKQMFNNGDFWNIFKKTSYLNFFEHYDGPLFERISQIKELNIEDNVFSSLLKNIYYPSPYRFDVIPTKLLGDIYEIFLSKKLIINNNKVEDKLKSEYAKTLGAVSTPQYIVNDVIKRTISKQTLLSENIEYLLSTKIVDFTCGSGVFLIQAYDYLEQIFKNLYIKTNEEKYKKYFIKSGDNFVLNLEGRRLLMDRCLYGVDIDPEAVEVTKVSMSLKIIEALDYLEKYNELGIYGSKILSGIGKNIKCGNSLVSNDILSIFPNLSANKKELLETNPFDWDSPDNFLPVFQKKGGFDYIIGNPPYVEVKNYNTDLPYMHKYIKKVYRSAKNGKVDLAIPFIERGMGLLNENGKLGFVVQKRFFKTDYGHKIRQLLSTNRNLYSIIDFENTSIFKRRITYISILILSKSKQTNFSYKKIISKPETLSFDLDKLDTPESNPGLYIFLPSSTATDAPWGFEDVDLIKIREELSSLGKLGDYAKVKVGIQALWDHAYHIKPFKINNGIIIGSTHLENNFQIELAACKPIICNENFFPFRSDKPDTFIIFPYDVDSNGGVKEISFSSYKSRYPLASLYLERHKNTIINNVKTLSSDEKWHLFTRVQNHGAVFPKVLTPMTAIDTYAMVSRSGQVYCDNANVYFIDLKNRTENNLYAIAAVINSTIFSVLARSIANPQSNGYFKFNKQFIDPVPFPVNQFVGDNNKFIDEIAELAKKIEFSQQFYESASIYQKQTVKTSLNKLWKELDLLIYKLYSLNPEHIKFFENRGRNKPRV